MKSHQDQDESITIPKEWFVHHADFDCEDVKLHFPKSLAYYLSTHFCGSRRYHESVQQNAKRELQSEIKSLLNIK